MNANAEPRFQGVDEASHDSERSGPENVSPTDQPPPKRVKIEAATEGGTESAQPKWCNPDPYTALPPPETLGAPKKDIVGIIRKAKMAATYADAVKNNAHKGEDYISLDVDDDDDDDDDDEEGQETILSASKDHVKTDVLGGPRGVKRNRDDSSSLIVEEWRSDLTDPTPWCHESEISTSDPYAR